MKIFIVYNEEDNLSNISNLLTTLDPENNYIIIDIEYILNEENFLRLKTDFMKFIHDNIDKNFELNIIIKNILKL